MNDDIIKYSLFAKNLQIVRGSRGLTSKQLSIDTALRGVKRIADIEDGRGKPTLEEIAKICRYLGVAIDDMINKNAVVTVRFI